MSIYNLEVIGRCDDSEVVESVLFSIAANELADRQVCIRSKEQSVRNLCEAFGIATAGPHAITSGYVVFGPVPEPLEASRKDLWHIVDDEEEIEALALQLDSRDELGLTENLNQKQEWL